MARNPRFHHTTMHATTKNLAEEYGLPFLDEVDGGMLDPALIASVPVAWAREQGVLPVRVDGRPSLLVGTPDCLPVLQHAQLAVGVELQPVLAPAAVIAAAIDRAYYEGQARQPQSTAAVGQEAVSAAPSKRAAEDAAGADLLVGTEAAPVTQLLNAIVLDAVRKRASDIHFEPGSSGLRVRFRIDGNLYEQPTPPRRYADAIVSRTKVMARMDISERRLPQDGMAQVRVGERAIDIRVSTVPVSDGERVVMRLLDRDNALLPLAELGMPPGVLLPFNSLLALPNGLVVVSGPTGSGKTTTLYSALGSLDASRRNILTVEEPVEYRLPSIGQIQVKPKIGLTFASGLRHILRQDPDVILVGETRDGETAEIAVRAALTGHLVFTTLHTNDAPSAVARLVDMGVEPYLLASCLRGVLAQRLVRRLCPACRRHATRGARGSALSAELCAGIPDGNLFEAVGCQACLDGYKGRTGLFELMPCTEQIVEAIHRGTVDAGSLRALAAAFPGYRPLRADAIDKLGAGLTDLREVSTALAV
jgi:general secretion pathway protein E